MGLIRRALSAVYRERQKEEGGGEMDGNMEKNNRNGSLEGKVMERHGERRRNKN